MSLSYTQFKKDQQVIEQKMRNKIIKKRNEQIDSNFMNFIQNKYKKLEFRQKYIEVPQEEINKEFDTTLLTYEYMR